MANKHWLEKAIHRGDDIYLATIHTEKDLVIDRLGNLKGAFANELRYLVKGNQKPLNVTNEQWEIYKEWFK